MSIREALNQKTLELRKSRDELAGVFQATSSQATAFAKERGLKSGNFEVTEEDAVQAIKKSIKQVRDTLALVATDAKSIRELEILESLLPRQASEDDLRTQINHCIGGIAEPTMKHMGIIMTHLTATFGPALDKSVASRLAKEAIQAV